MLHPILVRRGPAWKATANILAIGFRAYDVFRTYRRENGGGGEPGEGVVPDVREIGQDGAGVGRSSREGRTTVDACVQTEPPNTGGGADQTRNRNTNTSRNINNITNTVNSRRNDDDDTAMT